MTFDIMTYDIMIYHIMSVMLCQSGQVCHVSRQSAGGGAQRQQGSSRSGLAVTIVPHGTKNHAQKSNLVH